MREGMSVFEAFGLSGSAEDVYRTMLQRPGESVEGLAALLDRPAESVRVEIASLGELALVAPADENSAHWTAIPPERAMDVLIAREERILEARRAVVTRSRAAIPQLVDDYVASRRVALSEELELLVEPDLVRSRLFQLSRDASRWTWAVHPGPALQPAAVQAALPLDRDAAARGIECRMIVTPASLGPKHWNDYLAELVQLGHQVRTTDAASQICIIVDGVHAVIPSSVSNEPPFGAYVLHGEALVRPVMSLVEELWSSADPLDIGDRPDDPGGVSDARMRQVANLLARGLKDDAVARRLGVSVRTVRRLISATLDELDAASRFQAGVAAAQRGWLRVGPTDADPLATSGHGRVAPPESLPSVPPPGKGD